MIPIKTEITKHGQPYVDEPIYSVNRPKVLSQIFAAMFRGVKLKPVETLVAYQKVTLNWLNKGDSK